MRTLQELIVDRKKLIDKRAHLIKDTLLWNTNELKIKSISKQIERKGHPRA